jgi:hypothetical protein
LKGGKRANILPLNKHTHSSIDFPGVTLCMVAREGLNVVPLMPSGPTPNEQTQIKDGESGVKATVRKKKKETPENSGTTAEQLFRSSKVRF